MRVMSSQITGTLSRLVRASRWTLYWASPGKAVFEVWYRTIQVRAGMMGVVQTVFPEYAHDICRWLLAARRMGNGAIGLGIKDRRGSVDPP